MKTLSQLGLTALMVLGFTLSAQGLVITPATLPQWTGNDNSNFNADDIEDEVNTSLQLTEVYKQNVGDNSDTGGFAGSYTTTFSNSANDPEDALIDYVGGPAITGFNEVYLYVKDGNNSPAFYIFNISGWNGIDDLDLQNFWPQQGAISHVAIYAGGTTTNVPDGGATVALLGLALGGIGYVRRKLIA